MKVSMPLVTKLFVAGLGLAIFSSAPAKAGPDKIRCWMTSDPAAITVPRTGGPCPKIAKNFDECLRVASDRGWEGRSAFYACTTMRFKG